MAYNNYGRGNGSNSRGNNRTEEKKKATYPLDMSVDGAERVMEFLSNAGPGAMVTTSQIRKFLTAVNAVSGKVDSYKAGRTTDEIGTLSAELQGEVKYLKVKLAYQVGRGDQRVKAFVTETSLVEAIDSIGSSVKKYEEFARYVEALIAFHKYYGGRDK